MRFFIKILTSKYLRRVRGQRLCIWVHMFDKMKLFWYTGLIIFRLGFVRQFIIGSDMSCVLKLLNSLICNAVFHSLIIQGCINYNATIFQPVKGWLAIAAFSHNNLKYTLICVLHYTKEKVLLLQNVDVAFTLVIDGELLCPSNQIDYSIKRFRRIRIRRFM